MLFPYFQALENMPIGEAIRDSVWLFPFIEAIHLVALAVIGGAVLVVDFRLLGLGLTSQSPATLERAARPWLLWSLVVLLTSGVVLFLSEAVKCYYSFAFWVKMSALLLVVVFTYTLRRRVALAEGIADRPGVMRLVGLVSIGLWSLVGWGGRWIGFS